MPYVSIIMVYPVKTDVIPLLSNLVEAVRLFGDANGVLLDFEDNGKAIEMEYHPEHLIPDLTQLLCQVITYTPQDCSVKMRAEVTDENGHRHCQITIFNTATNLEGFKSILQGLRHPVRISSLKPEGTAFALLLPMEEEGSYSTTHEIYSPNDGSNTPVPEFYKKLRKQLHSHFSGIRNLEKAATSRSPKEGIFLKKLNAILMAHLDQEGFEAADLARSLALSRSQLYRRLKPLVGFSPAHYIRYVRLQKAKEFLEKGEGNIGDAAFSVGFVSQSHFTRAFKEQFGFNPSHITKYPL